MSTKLDHTDLIWSPNFLWQRRGPDIAQATGLTTALSTHIPHWKPDWRVFKWLSDAGVRPILSSATRAEQVCTAVPIFTGAQKQTACASWQRADPGGGQGFCRADPQCPGSHWSRDTIWVIRAYSWHETRCWKRTLASKTAGESFLWPGIQSLSKQLCKLSLWGQFHQDRNCNLFHILRW